MTVLEHLVVAAASDPQWSDMIPTKADAESTATTGQEWGRKGGSHYKDGQFTKK